MSTQNELPAQGRTVTVSTMHGDGTWTHPEAYLVAIDDDEDAMQAVRVHLRIGTDDGHRVEVLKQPLTKGSMGGMSAGEVMYWSPAPQE